MQIIGIIGIVFGGIYSAGMIVGAGIGSPTGSPHDSYYVTASWMLVIPALVFLAGWIWVVIGFLTAPTTRGNRRTEEDNVPRNR
jgi:NADH:ubiquinone oxidoreductase subunit 5 (subunit L)/multisubunit Na+/H+ antiporter MnhA subunit